ncbi:unnamed protein product, partial [Alternaria alternata]
GRWSRFYLDLQTHIGLLAPRSPHQGAQKCAHLDVRLRCRRTEAPQYRWWKHGPRPRKVSGAGHLATKSRNELGTSI